MVSRSRKGAGSAGQLKEAGYQVEPDVVEDQVE
jgi:hypothetical protein